MAGLIDPNRPVTAPDPLIPVVTDYLAQILAHPNTVAVHLMREENITFESVGSSLITAVAQRGDPDGRLLRQADESGRRPAFQEYIFHGHGAAKFDGNDVLSDAGDKPISAFTEAIIFEIDPAAAAVTSMTLSGYTTSVNHRIFLFLDRAAVGHQLRSGGAAQPEVGGLEVGKQSVVFATFDRVANRAGVKLNDSIHYNVPPNSAGTFADLPTTTWYLGGGSTSAASPFTGWIGARFLFNVDIFKTGNEVLRDLVLNYIRSAYEIAV